MSEHETGQLAQSAAAIYESFFVPALFADWPPRILEAAQVQPGDRVLDVACGTGVLARAAAPVVGSSGAVVGVDINPGMLDVARTKTPGISWQTGAAESLPFAKDSFDRVLCQFGLMFFQDRPGAIAEMIRVARSGGSVAVAVWAALDVTPGYAAMADILKDLFGSEVARSIEAPYCLGDTKILKALFADAGATEISIRTVPGRARFASVEEWIYTDIRGWTLADVIDDQGFAELQRLAPPRLSRFVCPDGSVEFSAPAHIVTLST